mmetsp:Transcript_8537/g.20999  ORF Transcript_8537/g.20999 Transcript_8537/m.20999 type:complete len:196 (+) Transcript_8537:3172-3759(+)|eukprot:CAMPEP_0173423596 /NCGR_PEP_ID=MMETSP1357-20121228/3848_1 /TAXON_ID=77926 /ORGANISM="Hemiselmis rufescens, Strain PCC563" /LENGTH=195 /DNA_ID=CAMNT_0014386739 /DNA_START=203 /DNA_END=790 /DNA_ORIENTATION=-
MQAEEEAAERKRREEEKRKNEEEKRRNEEERRRKEEEESKRAAAAAAAADDKMQGEDGLVMTSELAKKLPITVTAAWDFETQDPEELGFKKGDKVTIVSLGEDEGWVMGTLRGGRGLVPTTHLESYADQGVSTGAGGGKAAMAEWDYEAQGDDELTLKEGERITILGQSEDEGWLNAHNAAGKRGLVPNTHIKMI